MTSSAKKIESISVENAPAVSTQSRPALRLPPIHLTDNGKVRLGGQGPVFRTAAIKDTGKVQLGGQGPIFR